MSKEELYETAYSPMFDCYVHLDHAHQDDQGEWIFTGSNRTEGLENHLFRKHELTNFCL